MEAVFVEVRVGEGRLVVDTMIEAVVVRVYKSSRSAIASPVVEGFDEEVIVLVNVMTSRSLASNGEGVDNGRIDNKAKT